MKPATLGTPKRSALASDAVTLERQRIVQRAIDELYFTIRITPSAYYSRTPTGVVANAVADVFPMANAVTSSVAAIQESRQLWVLTRPRMNVWYTSTTGGTATFDFTFDMCYFGAGGNTTGVVNSVAWSAAGPAVANDILKTSVVLASPFPTSPFGIVKAVLSRIGGTDANNNALQILLATVVLEEVA